MFYDRPQTPDPRGNPEPSVFAVTVQVDHSFELYDIQQCLIRWNLEEQIVKVTILFVSISLISEASTW